MAVPKLKIGDTVKLIATKPRHSFGPYVKTGHIGTVRAVHGHGVHVDFPKHKAWVGLKSEFELVPKTPKTPKKEPVPVHQEVVYPSPIYSSIKLKGKDLVKTKHKLPKESGPRKPADSKYPKPRVAIERTIPNWKSAPKSVTKDALLAEVYEILADLNAERTLHATTGTKLDRASVDLKEAKKRIKELEAAR